MDHLSLGSAPTGEDCAQLGHTPNYEIIAVSECTAYIGQLWRSYQKAHGGKLPACHLKVQANAHDFGIYYDVVTFWVGANGTPFLNSKEAEEDAYWLEAHLPESWDEEALKCLGRT